MWISDKICDNPAMVESGASASVLI